MEISSDLKEKIENNALSVATVDSKGKPHCIAVGFCKVVDNKIIITDNFMSETPRNIKSNPSIAITLYSRNWEDDCWGFEIRGTAKYFKEGKWRDFVKSLKENKGCSAKGAIVITVEKIKKLS